MKEEQRIRREKLRWHCRRALLELDIVFQRFWARIGDGLDETTETQLARLLEIDDHDLWELISGRTSTDDPQLERLLERLRGLSAVGGGCQ